jgi:hypothetical protein
MVKCYIDVIKRPARNFGSANLSRSKEIKMYANRFFTLLVVVALASITALTVQEAIATKAVALVPQLREAERQRIRAAEVARWTAMGEYYENVEAAKLTRSRDADTARWMGQAEYHEILEKSQNVQRSRAADTARWMAMSAHYQNMAGDQVLSRAQSADAARWTAIAKYYIQSIGTTR